jgi:hypothetical protein
MENENVIDKVSADKQVKMLMDYYDIDLSILKETMKSIPIDFIIKKLTKHVEKGLIEIADSDNGVCVKQFLKKSIGPISVLEYGSIGSKSATAIDGIPSTESERKKQVFLGVLCKKGPDVISDLEGKDWIVAETVNTFLSIAQIG